jgi:hypothetical protein
MRGELTMTIKNERYKGAPEGQLKWAVNFAGIPYLLTQPTKEIPPEEWDDDMVRDAVMRGCRIILNLDRLLGADMSVGTANLLADAAINAALVEKQQEEIESLRQALAISVGHVEGFLKMIDKRDAELAALKAKFTPRPMSEAPRGQVAARGVIGVFNCSPPVTAMIHWNDRASCWQLVTYEGYVSNSDWLPHFQGWLPADTFKGGGDAT